MAIRRAPGLFLCSAGNGTGEGPIVEDDRNFSFILYAAYRIQKGAETPS